MSVSDKREEKLQSKFLDKLVPDIFLSQSEVEQVMRSETFPKNRKRLYSFNRLSQVQHLEAV